MGRKVKFQNLPIQKCMYRLILLFSTIILGFGCVEQNDKTIDLSEEKIVNLITELQVANAAIDNLKGPIRDSVHLQYMEQISARFKISSSELKAIIRNLENDPKSLQTYYEKARNKLDDLK